MIKELQTSVYIIWLVRFGWVNGPAGFRFFFNINNYQQRINSLETEFLQEIVVAGSDTGLIECPSVQALSNPLNAESNPICHLLTLLGAHRILHISRIKVNTIHSPDDEHRGARNMQRIGINIYERRIVRQVGHLQELNS